jgi:hypothetical protein
MRHGTRRYRMGVNVVIDVNGAWQIEFTAGLVAMF